MELGIKEFRDLGILGFEDLGIQGFRDLGMLSCKQLSQYTLNIFVHFENQFVFETVTPTVYFHLEVVLCTNCRSAYHLFWLLQVQSSMKVSSLPGHIHFHCIKLHKT